MCKADVLANHYTMKPPPRLFLYLLLVRLVTLPSLPLWGCFYSFLGHFPWLKNILALGPVFLVISTLASLENFIINWDNPSNLIDPQVLDLLILDNILHNTSRTLFPDHSWGSFIIRIGTIPKSEVQTFHPEIISSYPSRFLIHISALLRTLWSPGNWLHWLFIYSHFPPVFTPATYKVHYYNHSLNYIVSLLLYCILLAKLKFQRNVMFS